MYICIKGLKYDLFFTFFFTLWPDSEFDCMNAHLPTNIGYWFLPLTALFRDVHRLVPFSNTAQYSKWKWSSAKWLSQIGRLATLLMQASVRWLARDIPRDWVIRRRRPKMLRHAMRWTWYWNRVLTPLVSIIYAVFTKIITVYCSIKNVKNYHTAILWATLHILPVRLFRMGS